MDSPSDHELRKLRSSNIAEQRIGPKEASSNPSIRASQASLKPNLDNISNKNTLYQPKMNQYVDRVKYLDGSGGNRVPRSPRKMAFNPQKSELYSGVYNRVKASLSQLATDMGNGSNANLNEVGSIDDLYENNIHIEPESIDPYLRALAISKFNLNVCLKELAIHIFQPLVFLAGFINRSEDFKLMVFLRNRSFILNRKPKDGGPRRGVFVTFWQWIYFSLFVMAIVIYFVWRPPFIHFGELLVLLSLYFIRNLVVATKYAFTSPLEYSQMNCLEETPQIKSDRQVISGWSRPSRNLIDTQLLLASVRQSVDLTVAWFNAHAEDNREKRKGGGKKGADKEPLKEEAALELAAKLGARYEGHLTDDMIKAADSTRQELVDLAAVQKSTVVAGPPSTSTLVVTSGAPVTEENTAATTPAESPKVSVDPPKIIGPDNEELRMMTPVLKEDESKAATEVRASVNTNLGGHSGTAESPIPALAATNLEDPAGTNDGNPEVLKISAWQVAGQTIQLSVIRFDINYNVYLSVGFIASIIPTISRLAMGKPPFGGTDWNAALFSLSFILVVFFLTFSNACFIGIASLDFQRRNFVMKRLNAVLDDGYILQSMAKGPETGAKKGDGPEDGAMRDQINTIRLDMDRAESILSWWFIRLVLMDYGRPFFQRISYYCVYFTLCTLGLALLPFLQDFGVLPDILDIEVTLCIIFNLLVFGFFLTKAIINASDINEVLADHRSTLLKKKLDLEAHMAYLIDLINQSDNKAGGPTGVASQLSLAAMTGGGNLGARKRKQYQDKLVTLRQTANTLSAVADAVDAENRVKSVKIMGFSADKKILETFIAFTLTGLTSAVKIFYRGVFE